MFGDLKLLWQLWGYWTQIKGGTMDTETMMKLATLLIPFIAPLITAGIKKILPKLPKILIVILQPILGAILGALTAGDIATGAVVGTVLGSTGIGVREAVDQGKKTIASLAAGQGMPRITPPKAAL